MKPGIHDLSLVEAMKLWGELVECLYDVHGFGGDTCELYAYRFGHYTPDVAINTQSRMAKDAMRSSATVLHALLTEFAEVYDCTIAINGRDLGDWLIESPYDWRAHVCVIPKPESRAARARLYMSDPSRRTT
jgi:hypothetical protein